MSSTHTIRRHLSSLALATTALLSGCLAGAQQAKGDPTCVNDGSFEADYYGCTGTPGAGSTVTAQSGGEEPSAGGEEAAPAEASAEPTAAACKPDGAKLAEIDHFSVCCSGETYNVQLESETGAGIGMDRYCGPDPRR